MTIEWVYDSASDCHEILINLRFNDGTMVFDWEGKASQYTEQIGKVELRVRNETPPHAMNPLSLSNVLFTPTGTTNLLSLVRLEQDGWEFLKFH
ncbi:hypothetical protein DD238_007247 [Peronospora effusa]|uniref:Uncharacterized protein n=1 Tax=Peronospora effusa TaxID=542832 RepID=A0A3M6VFK1_9STRA|nr:hypothetical protein DD238_007247 [Peronospora effusa]